MVKQAAGNWMKHNAMRLSAALALYSILSMAPLLVILVKVAGVVWRSEDSARKQVTEQISSLMGPQAAEAIEPMLNHSAHSGGGTVAAIVSTAVLLLSATGVFAELQDSMNLIWGVKAAPNRGFYAFIRNRLMSMAMVLGIAFLLLVSMFVSAVVTTVAHRMFGNEGWIVVCVDFVGSFVVAWVLFAAIFKFLPDVKLKWRHVAAGALLTTGLYTAGKFGLSEYFKLAAPTSAYGAAGSLAAVMLWVYYSAFILFFGAEFTKVWTMDHDRTVPIEPFAVPTQPSQ